MMEISIIPSSVCRTIKPKNAPIKASAIPNLTKISKSTKKKRLRINLKKKRINIEKKLERWKEKEIT